jgi:hypothetical protein
VDIPAWFQYKQRRKNGMKEILIIVAVVGVWVFLQAYLLPKLGIST